MKRLAGLAFIFFLITLVSVNLSHPKKTDNHYKAGSPYRKVNYLIDFSDFANGSVEKWLEAKGFRFERDARDRKRLALEVNQKGLVLHVRGSMFGLMLNEGVDLENYSSIRLEWGVINYPKGVSYEAGIRNEALLVIVFFGYDKISSGHLLIPNAPYFIGFFLCKDDVVGKSYEGDYYQKSGRYVCLGRPKEGQVVISEYNLVEAFKRKYGKEEVPEISGIALAVDTTKARNQGKSKAFIKKIEFLE